MIEGRGWTVKVFFFPACQLILSLVGSGICLTPLVDRQNLTAKALSLSLLEFNAFNAQLKGSFHIKLNFCIDSWTVF